MEIQVLEQNSNAIAEAYKVDGGAQSLFDRIAEQARSVIPDLSTDKGRKAIASVARKVASSKTAFDAHGKELKEQYTAITSKIDADRKLFRDQCDALRDEIRKPLTDWEDAEKDRVEGLQLRVDEISLPCEFESSQFIKSQIEYIKSIEVDDSFMEFKDKAKSAKFSKLEMLNNLLTNVEKKEEEEAQLEKQRIEEQQRIQQERDEKIAHEAKLQAEREAEEKARIERERVEKEKKDAFEKSQREKREAIEREEKLKHEAEQALIREAQLKEQAEQQAKQAEIDKQQAIEAERNRIEQQVKAKAEAELKEQQAREANKAHKKAVCDSILVELAKLNIDEATGQNLIKAIYNNQIPNISIKF